MDLNNAACSAELDEAIHFESILSVLVYYWIHFPYHDGIFLIMGVIFPIMRDEGDGYWYIIKHIFPIMGDIFFNMGGIVPIPGGGWRPLAGRPTPPRLAGQPYCRWTV